VSFEVIPAIDLVEGRLGRLSGGRPAPVEAFGGDPLRAAEAFIEMGARWIHVVDVDLAFTGRPSGLDVIRWIAALPVRVQASGGLATDAEVASVLEAGAARAVLGSAALAHMGRAVAMIERHGERLAVGLEMDGATVRPRGRGVGGWKLGDVLSRLEGARRFVVTAVGRVGERSGPDLDGAGRVARTTGGPVIAAGGIATLADLEALAALDSPLEGAIVGSALYDGTLDLADAIRTLRPRGD
jgi:phosphoribosylformimino-5-aminoimidazole carboxamide ribonucleotide (ProFAR) isomerase